MNIREEFKSLFYDIKYSNLDYDDFVISNLESLKSWIKDNIPSKLYRYRTISDYSIKAFEHDEIWGSSYDTFNDPLECTPCYDEGRVLEMIDDEFDLELIKTYWNQLRSGSIPKGFLETYPKETLDLFINFTKKISFDDYSPALETTRNVIRTFFLTNKDSLETHFFNAIKEREQLYLIACFSEDVLSSPMWGHYADSHKGFCLEYDIRQILTDCNQTCSDVKRCNNLLFHPTIAPVIYSDSKYDASETFKAFIMNLFLEFFTKGANPIHTDMLVSLKTLLTKSEAWSYEKEWRMFYSSGGTKHGIIAKLKPSAIYLGNAIESHLKNQLIETSREKGIACYQMERSLNSKKYELFPLFLL